MRPSPALGLNPTLLLAQKLRTDSPPTFENQFPTGPSGPFPLSRIDCEIAMSLLCRPLLLAVLVALTGGAAGLASAQSAPPPPPNPQVRSHQDQDPSRGQNDRVRRRSELSDSVRRVERETRGQVLSAERLQYDGRELNRVKVVDDKGRVRVYVDDPAQRGRGGDARTRRDDDDKPNL